MLDHKTSKKVDSKEFELPETLFVRDIDDSVFQSIVVHCLSKISGISLAEGNFIDSILGRETIAGVKGIHIEQNSKGHTVALKVEVNVCYGVSIPEKAEEIQSKLAEELTDLTGLHVSCVHVVFKGIAKDTQNKKGIGATPFPYAPVLNTEEIAERYTEEF